MLEYTHLSIFVGMNFIVYIAIHFPLDFKTYQYHKKKPSRVEKENPPEWNSKTIMIITLFPTAYLWLLFLIVPFTGFLDQQTFYNILLEIEPINTFLQLIGLLLIAISTIVACFGRISRGDRAISWGIPIKLEIKGMYRFIRHPLYASYCYYFLGFSLIFQSLLIFPLLIGIYGYYKTSIYEESLLVNYFGNKYEKYQKNTGRFLPRVKK
ncbi:MAG: methyltransferase family protein [Candidatus Hodarchaeota archaeon]